MTGEEAPKFSSRFPSRDVFVRGSVRTVRTGLGRRHRFGRRPKPQKKKKKKLLAIGHFSLRSWRFFGFFFSFVFHKVVKRNLTRAKAEPRTKKLENDGSR